MGGGQEFGGLVYAGFVLETSLDLCDGAVAGGGVGVGDLSGYHLGA